MYGLLLQAALEFISSKFSADIAHQVLSEAAGGGALDGRIGLGRAGFAIHQLYSDKLLIRLAQATAAACDLRLDQVMEQFGHFFVRYTHQAGYENLLRVLGRNLSDFVLGLDNLHEYFRGTYPKIKAPSFSVVQEDNSGMTICYRSSRSNLHGYVAGQLSEVARLYYGISITVSAQSQQIDQRGKYAVLMRLDFDNSSFVDRRSSRFEVPMPMPPASLDKVQQQVQLAQSQQQVNGSDHPTPDTLIVRQQKTNPETMFDTISFYIILNHELEIVSVGRGINFAMPSAMGRDFNEVFELIRPAIPCTWTNILDFSNNVFEIHSLQPVHTHLDDLTAASSANSNFIDGKANDRAERFVHLRLRGQMIHFEEWDCLIFVAMPIIDTLKELNMLGLKIHDLSMRDSSRELITMRHHRELGKDPWMVQEAKIGNRLDQLNDEANIFRQRRAALLEEAIPRFILKSTERLTKSHYSSKVASIACTLSFSKPLSSQPVVKEVIMTLNAVFRKFDNITARYNLCKILTIANEFQLLVGVPFHCHLPCNLAMLIAEELIDAAEVSNDLLNTDRADNTAIAKRARKSVISDIQIAVDVGSVLGTVIGVTIPRYLACGRPVTVSQKISQIAIPNTVTVTENVVLELKKNEFSLNYDYRPLVTIQLPMLCGVEDVELYTVSSVGRKLKREEIAAARASRRRTILRNTGGGSVQQSSSSSMSVANEPKDKWIEPKLPKWMSQAHANGEAIPMAKLLMNASAPMDDLRTNSVISSTPTRFTPNSRSSTHNTLHKESSLSTPSELEIRNIAGNNGNVISLSGAGALEAPEHPCEIHWRGCVVS